MKFSKFQIFGIFVKFGVIEAFFKANCIYLFEEASWTTNFPFVEAFQRSKLARVSKIALKC